MLANRKLIIQNLFPRRCEIIARASLPLKQFLITGRSNAKVCFAFIIYSKVVGKAAILIANPLLPSFNTQCGENLQRAWGS